MNHGYDASRPGILISTWRLGPPPGSTSAEGVVVCLAVRSVGTHAQGCYVHQTLSADDFILKTQPRGFSMLFVAWLECLLGFQMQNRCNHWKFGLYSSVGSINPTSNGLINPQSWARQSAASLVTNCLGHAAGIALCVLYKDHHAKTWLKAILRLA